MTLSIDTNFKISNILACITIFILGYLLVICSKNSQCRRCFKLKQNTALISYALIIILVSMLMYGNKIQMNVIREIKGGMSFHTINNIIYEDFTRNKDVVIVTKTHGILVKKNMDHFRQWICLISHAYNDKANHDIVIFTTMPWEKEQVEALQKIAAPSNLTVALDASPLEEQLGKKKFMLKLFKCKLKLIQK